MAAFRDSSQRTQRRKERKGGYQLVIIRLIPIHNNRIRQDGQVRFKAHGVGPKGHKLWVNKKNN